MLNDWLARSAGLQVVRANRSGSALIGHQGRARRRVDRLVHQPTFLLSAIRSGSTLLRVILDTHSQICAPHELHLRTLRVSIAKRYGEKSMAQLGLDQRGLEHLLWDRILHRELMASGKSVIVDKTPPNLFMWERLPQAWPKARFIFLLRHPAGIYNSILKVEKLTPDEAAKKVNSYARRLQAARSTLPGISVRYEDLVSKPEQVTQQICEYLEVPWEQSMLDYGSVDHGPFRAGIGDWSQNIKSGQIQSDIVLPTREEVPESLVEVSRQWAYLD